MAMDQLAGVVDDIVDDLDLDDDDERVTERPSAAAAAAPPSPLTGGAALGGQADRALSDALSYLRRFSPRPGLVGMP